jgi:proteasome lid subunit RPN8/RPN11
MSLALNKPKLDNHAGDIWKSAERLRGKFKAYEYQSVILPIIVIRRLECVLLAWREAKRADVLAKRSKLTQKELAKLVKDLELNPHQCPFSNKTDWTLRKVYEEDHALLETNFRAYINGFSKNVDDIIEHFNYRATIGTMVKNNRPAPILNQYKELALGPDQLAAIEFARRRIKPAGTKITTPADLLPLVRHYADRRQEHFLCATINGANEVLNIRVISIGLVDRSPVHPREVFADAVADRASGIIVAHNHPEGRLEPSAADVEVTCQVKQAGEIVGIHLLDHIIFNPTTYFSFLEAGQL